MPLWFYGCSCWRLQGSEVEHNESHICSCCTTVCPAKLGWFQIALVICLHAVQEIYIASAEAGCFSWRALDLQSNKRRSCCRPQSSSEQALTWWLVLQSFPDASNVGQLLIFFMYSGNEPTCSLKHPYAHHFECSIGWLWLLLVQDYGPEVHHISTWVDSSHFHSGWIWQLDTSVKFRAWKPKTGKFGGTFKEVLDLQQGTFLASCWISLGVSLLVSDSRLYQKHSNRIVDLPTNLLWLLQFCDKFRKVS